MQTFLKAKFKMMLNALIQITNQKERKNFLQFNLMLKITSRLKIVLERIFLKKNSKVKINMKHKKMVSKMRENL